VPCATSRPSLAPVSSAYDAVVLDDVGVLSGVRADEAAALEQVVRELRSRGLKTALLSNAGGCGRPDWADLFDLVPNVRGAAAAGMTGVHHTSPERTVEELEILLGVRLSA
jgi:hypothetical protein